MHPVGGGAYLPMTNALARAGHHVIYANSRYRGADYALIMEKVAQDLGAAIRDAKERLGYERIVLAGWSGGGSLSVFYQQQAQHATVTASPAGEPPDLTREVLPPADALLLLAAHVSRHGTLTEWMDPAIVDEADPAKRDPELDIYNPDNPNQPPYTAEFLERYRAAQIERNRRITRWVKDTLESVRASGRPLDERGFVVHGTMADPRWLDPAIDPNDREPGTCYLGRPAGREHGTGRPGPVLHPAQLAVAVELRRRSRRRRGMRRATWRFRPSSSATAPTTRARRATPSACSTRSGTRTRNDMRSRARPTTTAGPASGRCSARRSTTITAWLADRGFAE